MMERILEEVSDNMFKTNNVLIVTHGPGCMDGIGSVLALSETFHKKPSKMDILFIQYGDDTKELFERSKDKIVIMCDFSLKRKELLLLKDNCKELLVIDHHATAEKELEGLDFCIFDMKESGATLTWKVFNPDLIVPDVLKYIKDRDLWDWELPNSKAISTGLYNTLGTGSTAKLDDVDIYNVEFFLDDCIRRMEEAKDKQATSLSEKDHRMMQIIDDHTIPFVNTSALISEVGDILDRENCAACMYFFTATHMAFSLRSNKKNPYALNVEAIAESYGGGGHKHAAGFSIAYDRIDINKLFATNNLPGAIIEKESSDV